MYRAPVSEISHTLMKVAGLEKALEDNRFPEFSADLAEAILEEAGRFAAERVGPLRISGDRNGATVKDGVVTTAPGWKDLYRDWIAGGWNAVTEFTFAMLAIAFVASLAAARFARRD